MLTPQKTPKSCDLPLFWEEFSYFSLIFKFWLGVQWIVWGHVTSERFWFWPICNGCPAAFMVSMRRCPKDSPIQNWLEWTHHQPTVQKLGKSPQIAVTRENEDSFIDWVFFSTFSPRFSAAGDVTAEACRVLQLTEELIPFGVAWHYRVLPREKQPSFVSQGISFGDAWTWAV